MNTMGVVHRGMTSVVIDLGVGPSARLLERAVRGHVPVRLEVKSQDDAPALSVRMAQQLDDALLVQIDQPADALPLESTYCDASFALDGQEYMFTTVVQEVIAGAQPPTLRIARPKVVHAWQRRRFLRAAFADSAAIYLGKHNSFDVPEAEGRILNVSQDGVACRVHARYADHRAVGEAVSVQFTIGALPEVLQLNAVIRSKTPGGTPGAIILGLQFEECESSRLQRERLGAALNAYL